MQCPLYSAPRLLYKSIFWKHFRCCGDIWLSMCFHRRGQYLKGSLRRGIKLNQRHGRPDCAVHSTRAQILRKLLTDPSLTSLSLTKCTGLCQRRNRSVSVCFFFLLFQETLEIAQRQILMQICINRSSVTLQNDYLIFNYHVLLCHIM